MRVQLGLRRRVEGQVAHLDGPIEDLERGHGAVRQHRRQDAPRRDAQLVAASRIPQPDLPVIARRSQYPGRGIEGELGHPPGVAPEGRAESLAELPHSRDIRMDATTSLAAFGLHPEFLFPTAHVRTVVNHRGSPVQHASMLFHCFNFAPHLSAFYRRMREHVRLERTSGRPRDLRSWLFPAQGSHPRIKVA